MATDNYHGRERLDIMYDKFERRTDSFSSVEEIDSFVEKQIGRKLEVVDMYPDITDSRVGVIPIVEMDADKIFDEALKEAIKSR